MLMLVGLVGGAVLTAALAVIGAPGWVAVGVPGLAVCGLFDVGVVAFSAHGVTTEADLGRVVRNHATLVTLGVTAALIALAGTSDHDLASRLGIVALASGLSIVWSIVVAINVSGGPARRSRQTWR